MEPVKGGMLATPPQAVLDVLKQAEPESSAASWGIRFAADLEGIITVLSGMSTVEQMRDNLSYMQDFRGLTEGQRATLRRAQEELSKIPLIPCTTCNYCAKVCPKDIGISGSFTALNYLTLYGDKPCRRPSGGLACGWTWEKSGGSVYPMRKMRSCLSAAYPHPRKSKTGQGGAVVISGKTSVDLSEIFFPAAELSFRVPQSSLPLISPQPI